MSSEKHEVVSIYPFTDETREELLSKAGECVFNWSTKDALRHNFPHLHDGEDLDVRFPFVQPQLPLVPVSKGCFDKGESNLHDGEDLDVPTFLRRNIILN